MNFFNFSLCILTWFQSCFDLLPVDGWKFDCNLVDMFPLRSNYFRFCQLSPFRRDQLSISNAFTFSINASVINVDIRVVS